jgi:hypothetical protein
MALSFPMAAMFPLIAEQEQVQAAQFDFWPLLSLEMGP